MTNGSIVLWKHPDTREWQGHLVGDTRTVHGKSYNEVIKRLNSFNTKRCKSILCHGPGHQSKTHCEKTGPHTIHRGNGVEWRGMKGFTGFFDDVKEVKWRKGDR